MSMGIAISLAFLLSANLVLFLAARRRNRRIYQERMQSKLRWWLDRGGNR